MRRSQVKSTTMSIARKITSIQPLRTKQPAPSNGGDTTVHIDKAHYTWKIRHYDFHKVKKEKVKSPLFSSTSNSKTKCQWYLELIFVTDSNSKKVSGFGLYLYHKANDKCQKVFAKYKLGIINENEEEEKVTYAPEIIEFAGTAGWGHKSFVTNEELDALGLIQENTLKIYCEVRFSRADVIHSTFDQFTDLSIPADSEISSQLRLSDDFQKMFNNEEFSDITISVNGVDYHAHKIILAARSPVFAAMFKHSEMKESLENKVTITDIDNKVMEQLLYYIYTGKFKNMCEVAHDLLMVSEKYGFCDLKDICEKLLIKKMSIENVLDMLVLADLHHAHKLKSKAMALITAESNQVVRSAAWKSTVTEYPTLIGEICEALSHKLFGFAIK